MSKSAYFNEDARNYLSEGLNLVANAVKSTLGPGGNTVVIQRNDKTPLITKDGVSVAKEIKPADEKIKLGADLAIAIANKQMSTVGDGTSTATVLGQAIVADGLRQIELSDKSINLTSFRRGLEAGKDQAISFIDSISKNIETEQDLINIATVSANGDKKLGKIVADAYQKVGKAGVVLVEETKDRDIYLDFKEGMTLNKGWTSQYFINNPNEQTVDFDNPLILLCNTKISNFQTLARIIGPTIQAGKPLVIIAESFDSSVTQGLAVNILQSAGNLKIACVEAPSYGERRLDILRDLAFYLGGEVGDDPMGISFEAMSEASFGQCEKIVIRKDETIIRGGKGDKNDINKRVDDIKGLINSCKENDTFEREQLGKRLASLTTGVAVIKVGGSSEEEIKELKDRLDDAQWAVKAALEEGYVAGAGNTLLYFSKQVMKPVEECKDNSFDLGFNVFKKALLAPASNILKNAGESEETLKQVMLKQADTKDYNFGFDSKNLKYVNLIEAGVIDPTKVVKGTIYAATSIAGIALTSSVMITEDPKKENMALNFNAMGMPNI